MVERGRGGWNGNEPEPPTGWWEDPRLLLVIVALWIWFAPSTADRELANDEAQARRHRERVEHLAPKAYPYAFETKAFDLKQLPPVAEP